MNGELLQSRRLTPKVSVCAKHLNEEDVGIVLERLKFCHRSRIAESYDGAESH